MSGPDLIKIRQAAGRVAECPAGSFCELAALVFFTYLGTIVPTNIALCDFVQALENKIRALSSVGRALHLH